MSKEQNSKNDYKETKAEKLEDIGFYTLSDKRAKEACISSPLQRCELILTEKCNFNCPYCRGLRNDVSGTMPLPKAKKVIDLWADEGLRNVRFSGGEPTMYPDLKELVKYTNNKHSVERIAISTNGYKDFDYYKELIELGVNDFSISLDACCSSYGDKMAGGIEGAWEKVVDNIEKISKLTYVTVGMVFDENNIDQMLESIEFADGLGVDDIRIVSSAQYNQTLKNMENLPESLLEEHPILNYRVKNYKDGKNVRGLGKDDCHKCNLAIDDIAIAGDYHFPCIIYLREGGDPIGRIGADMRKERRDWIENHDSFKDDICRKNCLDVCIDYNNKFENFKQKAMVDEEKDVYEGPLYPGYYEYDLLEREEKEKEERVD